MNTVDVLKAARDIISTPDKWTQRSYARAADNYPVAVGMKDACKFCALGAVLKVSERTYAGPDDFAPMAILEGVAHQYHDMSVVGYNDSPNTSHQDIMELYDRAIQEAQRRMDEPDPPTSDIDPTRLTELELLQKLHDSWGLVKYYESPSGGWAKNTNSAKRARNEFSKLLNEASERGLNYMECLQ